MQVQFGTSGKRINSTKIPTVPITKTCVLKKPCTMENPVLEMSSFDPGYSVAYIPTFGRYYFIRDIEHLTNNITRYYLTVDPLASHKTKILANTVFVERSQSNYSNYLHDECATHLDQTPDMITRTFSLSGLIDTSQTGAFGNCTYILQTIAPGTTNTIGAGTCTYALDLAHLTTLIGQIFNPSSTFYGTAVSADEVKTYFNPFQYIVSCQWLPIDISEFYGTTSEKVKFGWWTSEVFANPVEEYNYWLTTNIVLPASLDWTDHDPAWHRMDLYIPGCGTIEVDPAYTGQTLPLSINVDLLTGNATAFLKTAQTQTTGDDMIAMVSGQLGISVQLSQLAYDPTNLITNALYSPNPSGLISRISGGQYQSWGDVFSAGITEGATSGLASKMSGIMSMIPVVGNKINEAIRNAMQPQTAVCGTNGNMSFLYNNLDCILTNRKYSIYETNIAGTYGKPCRRNLLLSNCSGFTLCNNASITVAGATGNEKTAIKQYLEGGFWIE